MIHQPKQPLKQLWLHLGSKNFVSIRPHVLEPIKQPLTASFDSNICKVFKRGNKTQVGRNPYLSELRKLPKSGTHVKPSPRRAVLLLVLKTADDRIARISRENDDSLSLENLHFGYWIPFLLFPKFFCSPLI